MFIAGENSGDLHGSRVIAELLKIYPQAETFGYGGERMERAGMRLVENLAQKLPIMGFTQVLINYPKIRSLLKQAAAMLRDEKPDLLVLIDYPGFNLRTARKARELGIPVVYYISPQVWAWHRSRLKLIQAYVDKMLVILPFEAEFYQSENIDAEYVGHPLQDDLEEVKPREEIVRRFGFPENAELIALMPGSRVGEVTRHLPVMLEAAQIIRRARPQVHFVLPLATTIDQALIRSYTDQHPDLPLSLVTSEHKSVRAAMDFVICKSGTSTLEYGLAGVPMVIIYKASAITAVIARRVVKIPHIGLVNIVAKRGIAPELWQEQATGERIAQVSLDILNNPGRYAEMKRAMADVQEAVGGPGASRRAAEAIAAMLPV